MSGKFALIIGNTEYIDPGLAQLTAPGKDAEDFARILKDKDLCAFDEVKIVLNQLSLSVIEIVDEFFDQKKPDDMLVLYFSGHGVRDEMGLLYLAVKNTIRSRLRSTAIRSDYIREAMDQSRSKRQILILDCCNSGAFPQGTKAEVGGTMGMTRAFQGYGRFVLTASDATQFAWEGDKVIGQTDNSLFTHFLVKGLEGDADSDGDGKITIDELYDYAYDQISRVTPKQTPTKSASKQEGEIILRQITRIEDIKPITLPEELIEATEDSRTFVREGAVQQLEKLLKGKNLGLARSAREALERIEKQDDSRRVSQAAAQVLEPIRQEDKVEEERKAREEAERISAQKAEEERIALEKAEAERLFAEQKAEEERKAKKEAKRLSALKAKEESLAREKAEAEQKANEAAERLLAEKKGEEKRNAQAKIEAEQLTEEKRLAEERAEKEAVKRKALRLEAKRKTAEVPGQAALKKVNKEKREPEVIVQTATQLKAKRSAAQKNIFSRIGYAWATRSTGVKIVFMTVLLTLGIVLSYLPFFTISLVQTYNQLNDTPAQTKLILPGDNPTFIYVLASTFADRGPSIYGLTFSSDGQFLAGNSGDIGFQIWNVKDGSVVKELSDFGFAITYSPDGKTLATTRHDKIYLYNTSDYSLPTILLEGHTDGVWDVAFSPDGKTIASASWDKTVRIWDASTGELLNVLEGHSDHVNSIAFSPNGRFIVSGSEDETAQIWDAGNGELIYTLQAHSSIQDVAYSPSGKILALASYGGIKLFDTNSFQLLYEIRENGQINCIAFSPDGNTLAAGLLDNNVILVNVTAGSIVKTLKGHTQFVQSVAFSPDGTLLASGASDGIIRLWEIIP